MLEVLKHGNFKLHNPSSLNLIVGRNGSGKSRFLRGLSEIRSNENYLVSYISPERAGIFTPESGIENTLRENSSWIYDVRNKNQADNFKRASAVRLKDIAMRFALRMEEDRALRDSERTFATEYLSKINGMLSNISIHRTGGVNFEFISRTGKEVSAETLSSGESEIISLATEIMHFFTTIDPSKHNILLIDEPDVHLHPDLQARLARFLINELEDLSKTTELNRVIVCISTHSTPLICSLSESKICTIGTKEFDSNEVNQKPIASALQKAAAFFGHSLSKCISNDVPIIIEGEDDERVWQQAARSSNGKIKIFPCLALTVDKQYELENFCNTMLSSIYDDPIALSLRDGDGVRAEISDIGCVKRFRLHCYSIENLLLTDEAITVLGHDWGGAISEIKAWIDENRQHKSTNLLSHLVTSNDRLRNDKIKEVRQLIPTILGSKKPWEVVVGQAIGSIATNNDRPTDHSIINYLGKNAAKAIGLINS